MTKLVNGAFIYLFTGLFMGAFYREFTKYMGFQGDTMLSVVHTHLIMLGCIVMLLLLILEKNFHLSRCKHYKKAMIFYNIGVIMTTAMMIVRGILTVLQVELGGMTHAISGIAGLGHIVITIGFIFIFIVMKQSVARQSIASHS